MPKNKTDMEILQRLVTEYAIHAKRYKERQSIFKDKIPYSPEMKTAAENCCNFIYNKYESEKTTNQILKRMFHSKEFEFFKIYYDKLQIQTEGSRLHYINAIEVVDKILEDYPGLHPATKLYPLLDSYSLYGDCFSIDGNLCLITGSGKSKAMRSVPNSKEHSTDFVCVEVKDSGLFFHDIPISYFIHMVGENEVGPEEITEVPVKDFIFHTYGNYAANNYAGPEEILPLLNLCEEFNIPMVLVPWGENFEDKIQALTDYFAEKKTLKM